MKISIKNIIILVNIITICYISFSFASEVIYDKQGYEVNEILKPTAEETIDPDKIEDALRIIVTSDRKELSGKNVVSDKILDTTIEWDKINANTEFTMIRHTYSIADVEDGKYELIEDRKNDRLKLRILVPDAGQFYAKNGFYKVDGKIYYFDENELMVLGNARDTEGHEFFFSYETGEMLKDGHK